MVELLLRLGTDPNSLDHGGHTPLYAVANECASEGGEEVVRALVKAGADVNACGGCDAGTAAVASVLYCNIATDWPGHFPNVRASVEMLIGHGADVNAEFRGRHSGRPLHWAASNDDLEALDALLDHHADIEAPGAVIGGDTPLADAVAFDCWRAAHRLVERGAVTTLGLMERVAAGFTCDPAPDATAVTQAFWCACHGGQLPAAEYLLTRSAEWVGWDGLTALDAATLSGDRQCARTAF